MIRIHYNNKIPVYIRPTPFISISHTPIRNKVGTLGCVYTVTLTGTIIASQGSPFFIGDDAKKSVYDIAAIFSDKPNIFADGGGLNPVTAGKKSIAIFHKQNLIRELFAKDGQKIDIHSALSVNSVYPVILSFCPNVVSIDFDEGPYIDTCTYTINLEAPFLFDKDKKIYPEGLVGSFSPAKYLKARDKYLHNINQLSLDQFLGAWGGFVEDFNDSWSIEVDDTFYNTKNKYDSRTPYDSGVESDIASAKSYRLTRSISATGRTVHDSGAKRYEAWEQALNFISKTLLQDGGSRSGIDFTIKASDGSESNADNQYHPTSGNQKYALYPGYLTEDISNINNLYSSGLLNLPSYYKGYNHSRNISFDKAAGSCSVTESWILASGDTALENYNVAIDNSRDNPRKSVKINGTIKGLSDIPASGYSSGVFNNLGALTPYKQALKKYFAISRDGQFGLNSIIYNRAKNLANGTLLNSQPLSVSLSTNELLGEISYNVEFDNRPLNYFSGVLSENIIINDTYPGDIYALIPVIGRKSGPIIQYVRSRTEYKRDVNIELLLDYTDISYASGIDNSDRVKLLLNKPSLNKTAIQPIREKLRDLLIMLSPSGDPNVTKYFLKPPVETWSPKEGRYSFSASWDYEKNL